MGALVPTRRLQYHLPQQFDAILKIFAEDSFVVAVHTRVARFPHEDGHAIHRHAPGAQEAAVGSAAAHVRDRHIARIDAGDGAFHRVIQRRRHRAWLGHRRRLVWSQRHIDTVIVDDLPDAGDYLFARLTGDAPDV